MALKASSADTVASGRRGGPDVNGDGTATPDLTATPGRTVAWLAKQVELGLVEVELSPSQYRVLGILHEHSAQSSDLAHRLAVRLPSVTAVIDGLVGRGLVERRTVEGDRRRVAHVLTEAGRRTLARADASVDGRLRDIAGFLDDPDEAGLAFDGLTAWRRAMQAARSARQAAR